MKKKKNKQFFIAFVIVWGVLILWNALTPPQEFSEAENRYLKAFPKFTVDTLLDGKFMDDINTYLNDQFAGRPYWVSSQSLMEYALGKREINGVYVGKAALLGDLDAADMELSDKNIAGVNAFAERYRLPVAVLLVPSATAVQSEKLPAFAGSWDESAYIAEVNSRLSAAVTPVTVYDTLSQHRDEYIYYRTDHHWTSYGASLAYSQLAPALGLTPLPLEDFAVSTLSENFYGTYHSKTGFPLVDADTMEGYSAGRAVEYEVFDGIKTEVYASIYFDEYLAKKDKYSYFLGQVQPYVTITTASDSGKKLIVFKDSYAHCLTPMLLGEYSEIRLVDLRFINSQDFDETLNITAYDEALFLYSTDVFAHQLGAGKLLLDKG